MFSFTECVCEKKTELWKQANEHLLWSNKENVKKLLHLLHQQIGLAYKISGLCGQGGLGQNKKKTALSAF